MFENYNLIKSNYESLQDNDFNSAFRIMKDASSEIAYLEENLAEEEKEMNVFKSNAESFEASAALKYAKDNPMNKAEKMSECDEDVLRKWNEYYGGKEVVKRLESMVGFLTRIYFDCKTIYERGNRAYRSGRDD